MKIITLSNGSRSQDVTIDVELTDNVVMIKNKLSKHIYINEKRLELLNGDILLDNNDWIKSPIPNLIYREILGSSNDIILRIAVNNLGLPALIQIDQYEQVGEVKSILSNLCGIEWISIFTDNIEELQNDAIIRDKFVDDSTVVVCESNNRQLTLRITNVIPKEESFVITCGFAALVAEIKDKLRQNRNLPQGSEIGLFSETEYLEDGKRLNDYSIRQDSLLFFVELNGERNTIEIHKPFGAGKFAKLFHGIERVTDRKLALKRYNLKKPTVENLKFLKYEIITFHQLQLDNPPRFVRVETMFAEGPHFYICMEYMKKGSVADHLPVPEDKIDHYSLQILEALDYLHGKKIIYRNMKCSSVLISEEGNIKLCNFHLSKYMFDSDYKTLIEGAIGSKAIDMNWAAPEVLCSEPYGVMADIWSFGATLIEMVTGERPYKGKRPAEIQHKISVDKVIEYVPPVDMSSGLRDIIESCTRPIPAERPTAIKLIEVFRKN